MANKTKQLNYLLSLFLWISLLFVVTVGVEIKDVKTNEDEEIRSLNMLMNTAKFEAFLSFWKSPKAKVEHEYRKDSMAISLPAVKEWMGCDEFDWGMIEDSKAYSHIPTEEDYSILIQAYRFAMARRPKQEQIALPPLVKKFNPNFFSVQVHVRAIPYVGRGVFAAQDIPKGTLISKQTNALEFYTEESFRDFMAYAVSRDSKIICDTLLWMYSVEIAPYEYSLCVDADDNSLYNSGEWYDDEWDDDDWDEEELEDDSEYDCDGTERDCELEDVETTQTMINVGQNHSTLSSTFYGCQGTPLYALRDIKAGEELLMSYSDFSEPDGWMELGLSHSA